MSHFLLTNAFAYARRKKIDEPIGFIYDKKVGAWVEKEDVGRYLVLHPDYPRIGSKKFDVETGEDHKAQ